MSTELYLDTARLGQMCRGARMAEQDFVKLVTWVDANAVYYGSYWGRIHIAHRNHPNFRPTPTLQQALATEPPLPDSQR